MTALPSRGVALRGEVWPGGQEETIPDGIVVIDGAGRVAAMGPADEISVPDDLPSYGAGKSFVLPGVVDAHVHLAFGAPEAMLAGGVVSVRDLGAPPDRAQEWRTGAVLHTGSPVVTVAGPLLTAPGGYPSTSWGAGGFAAFIDSPAAARAAVAGLAADVDLVKLALEPAGGLPVPSAEVAVAVVRAAHEAGLAVTAHALTNAMVERALDAGVDELCHTPVEQLPERLVHRIKDAGIPVVSTLQTFHSGWGGRTASANASALVKAGVRLVYGTDLGNAGTKPGVDRRELDRLSTAGLGPWGALRAATGSLEVGAPAYAVVLTGDPSKNGKVWKRPVVVLTPTTLLA